jgi:hypothetical protein
VCTTTFSAEVVPVDGLGTHLVCKGETQGWGAEAIDVEIGYAPLTDIDCKSVTSTVEGSGAEGVATDDFEEEDDPDESECLTSGAGGGENGEFDFDEVNED